MKLSDKNRKELLNCLNLSQLKSLARKCGYSPPYVTFTGRKWIKHDFVANLARDPKFWKKDNLVKFIKKESRLTTGEKRAIERKRGFKCEACGRSTLNVKPDVHHIKLVAEGGSSKDDNLIVLCSTCHRIAHTYKGKPSKNELKKYIKQTRKKK